MRLPFLASLLFLPTGILSFVVLPDAPISLESVPSEPSLLSSQPDKQGHPSFSSLRAAPPSSDSSDPLPVILWHGLGDSADAEGLKDVASLIDEIHPGTYVYIISLGDKAGAADRSQSFFGNLTEQIAKVCDDLSRDQILMTAPAVDAIGFSQGGQFLRGLIERCGDGTHAPKFRSLITWGSQHNGIAEFQRCESATDWVCQGANALLKGSTVWSDFVQNRLVPAQYYRVSRESNEDEWEKYLAHSNFLADVNNERAEKNATYKKNLERLERFVMVVFGDDKTVVPKESGWFANVVVTEDGGKKIRNVTELRDREVYKQDWLGLKTLDDRGALVFEKVKGEHMDLTDKDLTRLFSKYLGPEGKTFDDERWDGEL